MDGLTIAMHLANPTIMRPSLRVGSSGRNAHANPSCSQGRLLELNIRRKGLRTCTYHQKGGDYPVDKYTERHLDPDLAGLEDAMQRLILHFAENRVHHNQETDGCTEKWLACRPLVVLISPFFACTYQWEWTRQQTSPFAALGQC